MSRAKIYSWIVIALVILLVLLGVLFYRSIIWHLVVSFILAYIIAPIINYAEKYQIPRTVSILVVYAIILVLISWLFSSLIPQIISQFEEVAANISQRSEAFTLESLGLKGVAEFLERVEELFPFVSFGEYREMIQARVAQFFMQIPDIMISTVSGIFSFLGFIVIIPVVGFFMLRDERRFFKAFFSIIPNRYFEFFVHLFENIEESFGKFFRALLLETIIMAILATIGLLILNVPYALILGIFVGLVNPIKYFGPYIGAVPSLLVVLLSPSIPNIYVIHVSLMFFIIQQFDSLILFPWLMGQSMDMHPLWILLTVIAGGYAFGVLGMVFAVPVVFLIKVIVEVSYKSLKEFRII
ncbi:MAG: AI-2E family transporter [Candidatus Cloacimonadia bacterium]